jgi:uncharacterized protein YxjI
MNNINTKQQNSTSIVQSGTFVGLRAESATITELFSDKMYVNNKDIEEVLETYVSELKKTINELESKLTFFQQTMTKELSRLDSLQLSSSLNDVVFNVSDLKEGSILVWDVVSKKWILGQLDDNVVEEEEKNV